MNVFATSTCTILTLSFAMAGACAETRAAMEIKLRDEVACSSSVVRLGDIAQIDGAEAAELARVGALPLMPAPAPGTCRYLRKREVEDLMAAHGLKLQDLRVGGAERIAIKSSAFGRSESTDTAGALLSRREAVLAGRQAGFREAPLTAAQSQKLRDELARAIEDYIAMSTGEPNTFRIECEVEPRHLAQLNAATSHPVCEGGRAPWVGRQQFSISFSTPSGAARIPVHGDVARKAEPVVVAVRPVARGEVITASHLELRDVENLPKGNAQRAAVGEIDEVVGMEARQAIREGDVVYTDKIAPPILVKRGDLVSVVAQSGGIRVRTTARAAQDGAHGKIIQVESLATDERFDVRVTGRREAQVFTFATADRPSDRTTASGRVIRK